MDALLLALLGWIGIHTGYDTRVELPNIVITEQMNMCNQYGIQEVSTCRATRLRGFYNRDLTIYLHAGFDPANPNDQSRLVHELIHYVQWHNGRGGQECWGKLEAEAYQLQDSWRSEHDIPARVDAFKLLLLEAACDA